MLHIHELCSCQPLIAQTLSKICGCLHSDGVPGSSIHPCWCNGTPSGWPHALPWLQGIGDACCAESPVPVMLCRFEQGDDLASESGNPLADTMLQIYDASDVGYVVWNDQVPGSKGIPPRTPHAHSKGEDGSGCYASLGSCMPAYMGCTSAVSCVEGTRCQVACCMLPNGRSRKADSSHMQRSGTSAW